MSIENLEIERYILNLSKKSITDFCNHINEKLSQVSHMIMITNSSNLSINKINYLLEFSSLNNIINVSTIITREIFIKYKFFIELCSFYFNSIYSNEKTFTNIFQNQN